MIPFLEPTFSEHSKCVVQDIESITNSTGQSELVSYLCLPCANHTVLICIEVDIPKRSLESWPPLEITSLLLILCLSQSL